MKAPPSALPLVRVPCNVCGADDNRVLYESPWEPDGGSVHCLATTDKFGRYGRVVRCRRCGLVYTNPRPAPGVLMEGYEGSVDGDYTVEGESRSINAYFCLAALRRHIGAGRLLEVGCSYGYFLNAARIHFDVRGVEPSREARRHAEQKLSLRVDAATLAEARYPDSFFDAAVLVDVIEHMEDPAAELRELRRILRPGGMLYLVTPDISGLAARLLRGRWWGLRPAHIYYFDRRTLAALLSAAGFEVVESRSFGRIFTYGYWLSRLQNYPRPLHKAVEAVINLFSLRDKFLYLDTRDSMQVVARRS
ncbi:MAG: methyltransferase domain-containing protein [Elusimicrobiota bacterium]